MSGNRITRVGSCRSPRVSRASNGFLERKGGSFRAPPRRVMEFTQPSNPCSPPIPSAVTIERASPEPDVEEDNMDGEDSSSSPDISWNPYQRRPSAFKDQFDEFVYKSQHIASSHNDLLDEDDQIPPHYNTMIAPPPEVNIELPSDSDSSRRPSKASFALSISNNSSMNNLPTDPLTPSTSKRKGSDYRGGGGASSSVAPPAAIPEYHHHHQQHAFLSAKPALDRRSSHTGVMATRNSPVKGHRGSVVVGNMNGSSPHHHRLAMTPGPSTNSNTLIVPRQRNRGASLPGNIRLDHDEIYRLRNFSTAGKKIINRGDSLKTRSNHSINSTGSR